MVIFCFFIVFVFSFSSVYIANGIYFLLFARQVIENKGRIGIVRNTPARLFFILFIFWATAATFVYAVDTGSLSIRSIIQYLFTLQYFILLVPLKINAEVFEKWIYRFSITFSLIIIGLFGYLMITIPGFSVSLYKDSTAALKYIPGWPNTTPIPLLVALWISLKSKKKIISSILFITAAVLTTSRGAYLGILLIAAYFIIKKILSKKMYVVKYVVWSMVAIIIVSVIGSYWILNNPEYAERILRFHDRSDIFTTTMAYIELGPLAGYGGNTIDQLQHVVINFTPIKNWGHTHNWMLEMLLRYGLFGLAFFTGFLVSLWKRIKSADQKFMFAVLVILAFFQTFMRDFIFITFLLYIVNSADHPAVCFESKAQDKGTDSALSTE